MNNVAIVLNHSVRNVTHAASFVFYCLNRLERFTGLAFILNTMI